MTSTSISIIHKYIRNEMFAVSRLLFCASPADKDLVVGTLDGMAALLHGHATHEDTAFPPLLREVDEALAVRMEEDHARLGGELNRICSFARSLDASDYDACAEGLLLLHLDWDRFLGAYLNHLDDEERNLFPALGGGISGPALLAQSANGMAAEQREVFLEKLWAVVTPNERAAIESALTV